MTSSAHVGGSGNAPDAGRVDETRLLREARRYEALLSAEGSIVWVLDAELRPTGDNPAWERYTGQSLGEYDQLGWLSAVHPDDRNSVRAEAERALASATPVSMEFRVRRADGEYRRHFIRAIPILESERVVEWIGTATDVEDVRRTADDQRDLRARLLALTQGAEAMLSTRSVEAAREGVVALARRVLPAEAHAIWWLDRASGQWRIVRSSGLSPGFVAQSMAGDPVSFAEPVGINDLSKGKILEDRREAYQAEGIASLLVVPLRIGQERLATVVMYGRSPHEWTETEFRVGAALGQLAAAALWNAEAYEALQRSRLAAESQAARMAFLADASALLGSLDYEATLREVAHLAIPGIADWCAVDVHQPDGLLERIVTAHVDPAKIELAHTLEERYPTDPTSGTGVPNVLRTGRAEYYPRITDEDLGAAARDEEHRRLLRELRIRSMLIAPLTARGHSLGAITFVRSSDDHAFTEDDLTVLTEVGRRAGLAIDNARLYRDAELANRAKDEFLAILSHELRTPLNAIMGWSHMLRDGLTDEMTRHAVEVIARNARAQKQLVEDLLDVARIAGGRLELQCAPLDLRDVARVAVDSALPSAQGKNITLSFEGLGNAVPVSGDANRLQQVLANLLSNALKFTDAGGRVTVKVFTEADRAVLAVNDTGIGISAEFLTKAFDRFRQADASLTRPYPGLGLGLWIVKQVVEAHGGVVRAESAGRGQGTTIIASLPLA